jgi:hypothetical protein
MGSEAELTDMMGYNPVWFWAMSFITLSLIFLTVFLVLRIRALIKESAQKELHTGFAGEIDKVFIAVNSGKMSIPEACQRVSVTLREFATQQTGVPANRMTLTDLKRAGAPARLVESIEFSYPIIFNEQPVENYDDFLRFMNSSRAILDGWWV